MLDIRIRTVPSLAHGATWLGLQLQQNAADFFCFQPRHTKLLHAASHR
jgi:hypothetical protein